MGGVFSQITAERAEEDVEASKPVAPQETALQPQKQNEEEVPKQIFIEPPKPRECQIPKTFSGFPIDVFLFKICKFLETQDIHSLSLTCCFFFQHFTAKENDEMIWKTPLISASMLENSSYRTTALRYVAPTIISNVSLRLEGPSSITDISQLHLVLQITNADPVKRYRLPFSRFSRSNKTYLDNATVLVFKTPVGGDSNTNPYSIMMSSQGAMKYCTHQIASIQQPSEMFTADHRSSDCHYQQFIEPNTTKRGKRLLSSNESRLTLVPEGSHPFKHITQLFKEHKVLYFRVVKLAPKVSIEELTRCLPEGSSFIHKSMSSNGSSSPMPQPPAHEVPFPGGWLCTNMLRVEWNGN